METIEFESITDGKLSLIGMIEPRDLNDLVRQSIENDNCSIVKVDEKFYFFDVDALTELLKTEEVIINSHWWKSENNSFGIKTNPAWPEQACRTFSFGVNCSDTFAYACADAEGFYYDELETVYAHWLVDPENGLRVWSMKKRGLLPIEPWVKIIKAKGIWDIDKLGIK